MCSLNLAMLPALLLLFQRLLQGLCCVWSYLLMVHPDRRLGVGLGALLKSTCKSWGKDLECNLPKILKMCLFSWVFCLFCFLILRARDCFASLLSHSLCQWSWTLQHVECLNLFLFMMNFYSEYHKRQKLRHVFIDLFLSWNFITQ